MENQFGEQLTDKLCEYCSVSANSQGSTHQTSVSEAFSAEALSHAQYTIEIFIETGLNVQITRITYELFLIYSKLLCCLSGHRKDLVQEI